jgi:hypothetical protein
VSNDEIRLLVTRDEMGVEELWASGAPDRRDWPIECTAADDEDLAAGLEIVAHAREGRFVTDRARMRRDGLDKPAA